MNSRIIINHYYLQAIKNEKIFYALIALIALLYLVTAMQFPVTIRSHTAHDDYLFWVIGDHIYNGNWLGSYSQMTLAKGAGFPLFLALNAHLGIPITLSIALFNLAAFCVTALSLIKFGVNKIIVIFAFAFALFNPFLFPTHIIRDNIYPAATLLAVFTFMQLCFSTRRRPVFAILSGLFLGYFLIIREEGIWIFPGILLFLSLIILSLYRKKEKTLFKTLLVNISLLACSYFLIIQLISTINFIHYDFYGTVDFKEEYYKKSVNILNSIEPKERISHVPVSEEQRRIAYSISPAFAELKEYFESKGKGWTQHLCNIYPWTCNDYAAGLFIWAYRDAVAELGYYKSGATASDFYKRIYTEVAEACSSKVIECKSNPFGFLPKLTQEQIDLAPASIANAIKLVTHQSNTRFDAGPSTQPYDRLAFAQVFLRNPMISPTRKEEAAKLVGWFYAQGNDLPSLQCNSNDTEYSSLTRLPSPDIMSGTNDPSASHQRFVISLNNIDGCQLNYNGKSFSLRDAINAGSGRFNIGNNTNLHFDKITMTSMAKLRLESFELKSKIIQIYKWLTPVILILGLVLFIVCFTAQLVNRSVSPLSIVALTLWTLAFTRMLILVLVDISSFPAIQSDYMGPAFPILALASTLSIALAIKFIHQIISRKNECN